MNKKYLMFGLVGIFAVGFVIAAVGYLYSQDLILEGNQVNIDGVASQSIDCDIGFECEGSDITITNDLAGNAVMDLASSGDEVVDKKYVSTLTLEQKVVNFELDNWDSLPGGNTIEVEYTIVGDEFSAEVIGEGMDGYVLVYYADNDDRFANPGEAVLVEDVAENLPAIGDDNIVNDYSAEYPTTPFGAKIWYVPSDAIPGGVVDWNRASEFLFETELIQFNSEGIITVYPTQVLTVTPVSIIDAGEPAGNYSANFNVGRTA